MQILFVDPAIKTLTYRRNKLITDRRAKLVYKESKPVLVPYHKGKFAFTFNQPFRLIRAQTTKFHQPAIVEDDARERRKKKEECELCLMTVFGLIFYTAIFYMYLKSNKL